jgi:cobalamin-dependent methionine synthase I
LVSSATFMSALLLIGETLNSTRPSVKRVFEERDEERFLSLAREQVEGGARCIDLNASMLMAQEEEALRWGASLAREKLGIPVMLDSANDAVLTAVARELGREAIVNSLSCDAELLERTLPVLGGAGAGVVFMLKDRRGIPASVDGKLALADRAVEAAAKAGIAEERLFIDPVLSALATSGAGLLLTLEAIRALAARHPGCRRIGGLSNVSFGLPERRLVNRAFAAMAIASGISALICDASDHELVETIVASEALVGADPSCRRFIGRARAERGGA